MSERVKSKYGILWCLLLNLMRKNQDGEIMENIMVW